jgi:hypothetical protein
MEGVEESRVKESTRGVNHGRGESYRSDCRRSKACTKSIKRAHSLFIDSGREVDVV